MKARKLTLFKINKEVVVTEEGDLTIDQIERMKNIICDECECFINDISVEFIEQPITYSDIDVGSTGMYNYKDSWFAIKIGVKLTLIEGSNEHLEAISNGTIEDYLIFV